MQSIVPNYVQDCMNAVKTANDDFEKWNNDFIVHFNLGISIISLDKDTTIYDNSILIAKKFLDWVSKNDQTQKFNIDAINNLKTHISKYSRSRNVIKRLLRADSIVDEF